MPARRYNLRPAEGSEIPISVLGVDRREEMLWIASDPALRENFPPCIKNILRRGASSEGKHRTAAILAAFLGQSGYSEQEARRLWLEATDVEDRIFSEWFQRMHCPKCETLKKESKGYPDLGVGGLGLCQPDERCQEFHGPVDYACRRPSEEDGCRGSWIHIKTLYIVRVFDWSRGLECEIELSEAELGDLNELLAEMKEQREKTLAYTRIKAHGRIRHRFALKNKEGLRRQMLSDLL
ncbi:MAG: hypothetical protein QUS07_01260 [Methanothrix sp.]|nr:hypothetical protein [Methanothrix sp.]